MTRRKSTCKSYKCGTNTKRTTTQSKKGTTLSTSTGNKKSGRRTTVSRSPTGKVSIYETYRTGNGGYTRKKR